MFDALTGRSRASGQAALRLEKLEDRDVPAVIAGFVYHDVNGNGLREGGETGIGGSTIQLWDSNNHLIGTTTTDPTGAYRFTRNSNITPGEGVRSYEVS